MVVGALVFSHFVLDVPMHTPDMPLLGENSYKLGFGYGITGYGGWHSNSPCWLAAGRGG